MVYVRRVDRTHPEREKADAGEVAKAGWFRFS